MEVRGSRQLVAAGTVLGIGLGGFIDGILLHQVLRWHHMVSSLVKPTTLSGLQTNILWDGIFHMSMWVVTAVGLGLLWGWARTTDRTWSTRVFIGLLLAGWGIFNVIDQLVFHLLIGAHHIREGVANYQLYDWSFFGFGVLLVAIGFSLAREMRQPTAAPSP
jgi:uncharacterized membrane protein